MYESVFKFPSLVLRAYQYGDAVQTFTFILQRFNLFADETRFFFRSPRSGQSWLFAFFIIGEQGFAEATLVMRNQFSRRLENMAG